MSVFGIFKLAIGNRQSAISLARLHTDDRGNIGTLLLLTVLVLVGLLAMIWNTTEVATRRQVLQNAADTSAHATATWISRCTNLETAQNMVICQDASMETIWRAVPPTDTSVRTELEKELAAVNNMLNGDPNWNQLRNQMLDRLRRVDDEYALTTGALATVAANAGDDSSDPLVEQQFQTTVRQAGEALAWSQNTYVNGQPAAYPGQPGPPGPNGQGLRQLTSQWSPPEQNETPMLQAIQASLQQQLVVLSQFEALTAPAESQQVPTTAANHEAEVFANEQTIATALTQAVQQQLTQQTDFYKVQLTLATTGRGAQPQGPAQVLAPVVPASVIPSVDGIDPINVDGITYPDQMAQIPASLQAQYPGLPPSFPIVCSIDGGWGHSYATPVKLYFNGRVWNDQQGLNVYMQQIDQLRQQLAQLLRTLRGLPAQQTIAPFPNTIIDSQPDPQGVHEQIPVLPRLNPSQVTASAKLKAAVVLYNKHGAAYTGAVRGLAAALVNWVQYFDVFTRPFAQATWHHYVNQMRKQVLYALGQNKQFMVLATYGLHPIPDWAVQGMQISAESAIQDRIVRMNLDAVARAILNALMNSNPNGLGSGFLDPTGLSSVLQAGYSQQASQAAFAIVNATAAQVAPIIAAEWVARPWPYEITPPTTFVPPAQGMTTPDRQTYFTVLTAALPTADTSPNLFLKKLMGNPTATNLLAHAQAESFNWMEFNGGYGGNERFDQVTWDNDVEFVGSPNPWRLSTIGGWNWNPRLAVADALAPAIANNPEMESYFQQSGVTSDDPQSIQTLTLH